MTDLHSRQGSIQLPVAKITSAELDAIEAELENPKKRVDVSSVLISIASAVVVVPKILTEADWYKRPVELGLLIATLVLIGVQFHKAFLSLRQKKTRHEENVARYIQSLRQQANEVESNLIRGFTTYEAASQQQIPGSPGSPIPGQPK